MSPGSFFNTGGVDALTHGLHHVLLCFCFPTRFSWGWCFHIWRVVSLRLEGRWGAAGVTGTGFCNKNLRKFSQQWFMLQHAENDTRAWGTEAQVTCHQSGHIAVLSTCSGRSGLEHQQNWGRKIKSVFLKNIWLFLLFKKYLQKSPCREIRILVLTYTWKWG